MNSEVHIEAIRFRPNRNFSGCEQLEEGYSPFRASAAETALDSDDGAADTTKDIHDERTVEFTKCHKYSLSDTGWLSSDATVVKQLIAEAVNLVSTKADACEQNVLQDISVRENWVDEICSSVLSLQIVRGFGKNRSKLVTSYFNNGIASSVVVLDTLIGDEVQRKTMDECVVGYFPNSLFGSSYQEFHLLWPELKKILLSELRSEK